MTDYTKEEIERFEREAQQREDAEIARKALEVKQA